MHTYMCAQAIPHVVAWRGREKDVSSWGLLASLWRREETDMGVPREDMGTLAGKHIVHIVKQRRKLSRTLRSRGCGQRDWCILGIYYPKLSPPSPLPPLSHRNGPQPFGWCRAGGMRGPAHPLPPAVRSRH